MRRNILPTTATNRAAAQSLLDLNREMNQNKGEEKKVVGEMNQNKGEEKKVEEIAGEERKSLER